MHPEVKGVNQRARIKQIYRPSDQPLEYWFPPKWGINDLLSRHEEPSAALSPSQASEGRLL
jgi:hypothetical protein